jgi:Uma2 family endonuclease
MSAIPLPRFSVDEYLEMDRRSDLPLEYHEGEVFPIAVGGLWHGVIGSNVSSALGQKLKEKPCRSATAVRLRPLPRKYLYPDLLVYCGKAQFLPDGETLESPIVVFEVLSPSTHDYDYGEKFGLYRKISSLREYVLIQQDRALVEVYRLIADRKWELSSYSGLGEQFPLESLGITLTSAEIYEGVEFPLNAED